MAVLYPLVGLNMRAGQQAGIKQDSKDLTLFLTLSPALESIFLLCALGKTKHSPPSWAYWDLLPVARYSDAMANLSLSCYGLRVGAASEKEGVNRDCVLPCQERLQPSGTLPSAEHGFSQPWGNEVIPQQVLFCLLSL